MVNDKAWEALPPTYQAAFERLWRAEHENAGELRRPQSLALRKLIAGGAKVSFFP